VKALFLALALLLAGQTLAADAALTALDHCRARLDPRVDVGLERIERKCPDLIKTLEAAPWAGLLPKGMRDRKDDVSAESLRQLGILVRRSNESARAREAPDTASLAPVLAALGEEGQQGVSRWERFKRWLKDKFERSDEEGDDDETSWLEKLGRQFETSEGVAKVITYIGYALVALLVAFVVWSELRAAGLLGGLRRATARAKDAALWRRKLSLADVSQAPLAERPGLLLKLLGEALTRAHRLPAADGLTAGAIAREARVEPAEREELRAVAATAEAVRYGAVAPSEPELEGAVTQARDLLSKVARFPEARR
jgi:hypothetical protein